MIQKNRYVSANSTPIESKFKVGERIQCSCGCGASGVIVDDKPSLERYVVRADDAPNYPFEVSYVEAAAAELVRAPEQMRKKSTPEPELSPAEALMKPTELRLYREMIARRKSEEAARVSVVSELIDLSKYENNLKSSDPQKRGAALFVHRSLTGDN